MEQIPELLDQLDIQSFCFGGCNFTYKFRADRDCASWNRPAHGCVPRGSSIDPFRGYPCKGKWLEKLEKMFWVTSCNIRRYNWSHSSELSLFFYKPRGPICLVGELLICKSLVQIWEQIHERTKKKTYLSRKNKKNSNWNKNFILLDFFRQED